METTASFEMPTLHRLGPLFSICILALVPSCLSGRFHCRPKGGMIISIGSLTHTRYQDNLVIEEDLKPEPLDNQSRTCSWVMELDAPAPRQVVLRGIPRSSLPDFRRRRSISEFSDHKILLSGSTSNKYENQLKKNLSLNLEMFQIFPLSTRDHFTLSLRLPHEKSPVSIAVSTMEPGYCAQDMVLHSGKCHLVIEQQNLSLTEAMKIISNSSSAGLQLASFTSLEKIKMFVKINYEPEFDLPPKQPLDLSKPVRIALFYSRISNTVSECVKTDKGCEMRKLQNSDEFVSAAKILDGPCGAIQALNSESAVNILFVSCDHSMPSLISFPETPPNTTCLDCNPIIDEWLGKQFVSWRMSSIRTIAICIPCILFIASVTAGVFYCHRRTKTLKNSFMDKNCEVEDPLKKDEIYFPPYSPLPSRKSSPARCYSGNNTASSNVSELQSKADLDDGRSAILEEALGIEIQS